MSRTRFLLLALLVAVEAGCASKSAYRTPEDDLHGALLTSYLRDQTDAGVVREHSVYPHYFVADSSVLNELGERDVDILIVHLNRYGGSVSVRRGDASPELHAARVSALIRTLQVAGVDTNQVTVTDAMPGGVGMSGQSVIKILNKPDTTLGETSSGSVSSILQGLNR